MIRYSDCVREANEKSVTAQPLLSENHASSASDFAATVPNSSDIESKIGAYPEVNPLIPVATYPDEVDPYARYDDLALIMRLERALLLVPVFIMTHAYLSYGMVQYMLKTRKSNETVQVVSGVYLLLSMLFAFVFTLWVLCQPAATKIQRNQRLIESGFTRYTTFCFSLLTFVLMLCTLLVWKFIPEMIILVCVFGIVLLCGFFDINYTCRNVVSTTDNIYAYSGLYFPGSVYCLVAIAMLFRKDCNFTPLFHGALMALVGYFANLPEIYIKDNETIAFWTLVLIVSVCIFLAFQSL